MKKLLLVIISFLGFAGVSFAQAAETQESAAKLEAQQATTKAVPSKFDRLKENDSQRASAKSKAQQSIQTGRPSKAAIKSAAANNATLPKKSALQPTTTASKTGGK